MNRSKLGLLAAGLVAVFGLSACSSSGSSRDVEVAMQQQIDGLQARVVSLESRTAWLEVVGRKVIEANPAVYVDQLTLDVAALEADFATAQANAAAAADQVAAEKAAAEKAVADARAAVDAAVAAENADDAAQAAAIEAAAARVADAKVALEALKQKIQDAIGSASPSGSGSASPTAS